MASGIRITGLRETVRGLERLGVDVSDIKGAFSSIASMAAGVAAGLAPHRTGRLAASIRGNKAKNKAVVRAGGGRAPYAGAINYGWARRGIAPSHFMQRADSVITPYAISTIDTELNNLIRRNGL